MNRINPDDPKWTAYILGELDDAERAAVELELESSEEARMLVEELQFAADLTKADLRQGAAIAPLTAQQREAIQSSATVTVLQPRRWFGARPAVWAAGLAAASIALMVALSPLLLRSPNAPAPAATIAAQLREPQAKEAAAQGAPTGQADQADQADQNDQTKRETAFGLRYEHSAAALATIEADKQQAAPAAVATEKNAPATARVVGRVQDDTAALIPGVAIVATNTQTGTVASTVTNESGAYTLDGLAPGTYKLSGSLPGFKAKDNDVQVAANSEAKKDIILQVGQASQSAAVAASADSNLSTTEQFQVGVARGGATVRTDTAEAELRARRPPGLQGQQGQQGQQGGGGARDGFGVAQIAPQAFASPTASPRAPGVPLVFDRTRGIYNSAEAYDRVVDNPFQNVGQNPLSTFSIDVDTAAYSNVRRFLNQNQLPPLDAVRIEEMINYFTYDYPQPAGNNPIGAALEAAAAPWNPQHRLVRIGIKARDLDARRRPATNLVFLIDVSGSMQPAERLPLLKNGIRMLVEQLTSTDRVTVVTYAGTTGIALRATRGDQKDVILSLIDNLQAGGSTNGASGIQLAYEQAAATFIPNGVNRVILATDGDFNVGITDRNALLRLIEDKAKSGVFLSVLGVGMGNYKDATLEMLADKGNGNYAYIDTLNEARKVLVDQMSGTLVTLAKDVKIQVEFNPAVVSAYRLIGYENRALRNEDFNNDLKDAGDMGAGHTVTALYEVVPRGVAINAGGVDALKYQQPLQPPVARDASNETLTVKVRYKEPAGSDSKLLEFPLLDREQPFTKATPDFRFASAVASFGMIMRNSQYKGTSTIDSVLSIAEDSLGSDRNGYRREFLQLVQRSRQLRGQ